MFRFCPFAGATRQKCPRHRKVNPTKWRVNRTFQKIGWVKRTSGVGKADVCTTAGDRLRRREPVLHKSGGVKLMAMGLSRTAGREVGGEVETHRWQYARPTLRGIGGEKAESQRNQSAGDLPNLSRKICEKCFSSRKPTIQAASFSVCTCRCSIIRRASCSRTSRM